MEVLHEIMVTSHPAGANLQLDGAFQCYTPCDLELTSGVYMVSLALDEASLVDRQMKVGPFSRGYIWCVEDDAWKSSSSRDWREAMTVCTVDR